MGSCSGRITGTVTPLTSNRYSGESSAMVSMAFCEKFWEAESVGGIEQIENSRPPPPLSYRGMRELLCGY